MGRVRQCESPTQILTRCIVCLFTLILLGMHISLGYYYFKADGSYYRHLVGFLTYVKSNVETTPIKTITVQIQERDTLHKNINDVPIFRWSGNQQGYKCGTTYSTNTCSTTLNTLQLEVQATYQKNFYFLPFTMSGKSYYASFTIERCEDQNCSGQISQSLQIDQLKSQFTLKELPSSADSLYLKSFALQMNSSNLIFDNKNLFYSIAIGKQRPCYNFNINSFLPNDMNFHPLYNSGEECDRFGNLTTAVQLEQNIESATNVLGFNVKNIFQANEMSISVMDAGLQFPSDPNNSIFSMFLLPKISLKDAKTVIACNVDNDLHKVPSYSNYINQTGLTMFILKQIFIVLLLPIPIIEMTMGCMKNPQVVAIGVMSKIMIIIVILCFIIEGGIVRQEYFYKTNLVNKIRNAGWKNCFTDDTINQYFMRFPSVFASSQDTYNYTVEIFMWLSSIGLFILTLLFIKLGMDMRVTKKKYGEYDLDENNYNDIHHHNNNNNNNQFQNQPEEFYINSQHQQPEQPFPHLPSIRQKLITQEKKSNFINEKNNNQDKTNNGFSKQYEMTVLSNSDHLQNSNNDNNN